MAYFFMEVLEPKLLDLFYTDGFFLFELFDDFLEFFFFVILDEIMDEVFECKYILINLVKPFLILYLLRILKFTVILIMSI